MHVCLQIPELQDRIVSELDAHCLVSLARVCKELVNQALDKIWRSIEGIEPFLACLPEELVVHSLPAQNERIGNIKLNRPIVPFDFERFRTIYAARIKSLEFSHFVSLLNGTPYVIQQLVQSGMLALPHLTSLETDLHPEVLPCIGTLLTPKIERFKVRAGVLGEPSGTHAQHLLESLPAISPALQSLVIEHSGWTGADTGGYLASSIIKASEGLSATLSRLDVVECVIETTAVRHLLSMTQSLVYLAVRISASSESSLLACAVTSCRSLQRLALRVENLGTAAEFMETVRMDNVHNFHAITKSDPGPNLVRLGKALQRSIGAAKLENVAVDWDAVSDRVAVSTIPARQSFAPFLPFNRLESFIIRSTAKSHLSIDLDSDTLRKMVFSWPHLRYLNIVRTMPYGTWVPGLKFKPDLIDLLAGCPNLNSIALDFDFTCDAEQLLTGPPLHQHQSLVHLNVGYGVVQKPKLLAAILSDTFPKIVVHSKWFGWTDEGVYNGRVWAEVDECLRVMSVLRQQERSRMPGGSSIKEIDISRL